MVCDFCHKYHTSAVCPDTLTGYVLAVDPNAIYNVTYGETTDSKLERIIGLLMKISEKLDNLDRSYT